MTSTSLRDPSLSISSIQIEDPPKPINDKKENQPNTWQTPFKRDVQEDDILWSKYLEVCDILDIRIIDGWTKIIDVILVYVALFSVVLTVFIIETSKQFSPDPAEVASNILAAMYIHQFNSSAPFVDPKAFLAVDPAKRSSANYRNALLYASLAISIVVAALAIAAKLWIIRYTRTVNAPGPPQSRAINRQKTYDGAKAWKLEAVIESLPVLVLIALVLFGIFIHSSVADEQANLGYGIGVILVFGLAFFLVASFSAAFIPTSPFQSAFSDSIHILFKLFPNVALLGAGSKITRRSGRTRVWGIIVTSVGVLVATPFLVIRHSEIFELLVLFPVVGAFALMEKCPSQMDIRPRIYGLPEWVTFSTIILFAIYSLAAYFSPHPAIYLPIFCVASVVLALQGYHAIRMSAVVPDTAKANAIARMLKFSFIHHPTWLVKACEIAGRSENLKALLLKEITPLLTPLITSIDCEQVTPQQGSYVECLAALMRFTPAPGSLLKNQAPLRYPHLSDKLTEKLRELEKLQCREEQNASMDCPHDEEGRCPHRLVQNAARAALTYLDLHPKPKDMPSNLRDEADRV